MLQVLEWDTAHEGPVTSVWLSCKSKDRKNIHIKNEHHDVKGKSIKKKVDHNSSQQYPDRISTANPS